jgi:hypothetical protein
MSATIIIMDFSHKNRTISEVVTQLKLRIAEADKLNIPEDELGSSILGFVWSNLNANELIQKYSLLDKIEALATNMDYQEYFQTLEFRKKMKQLVEELEEQVAEETGVRPLSEADIPAWTIGSVVGEIENLLDIYKGSSDDEIGLYVANFLSNVSIFDELSSSYPQLITIRELAGSMARSKGERLESRQHMQDLARDIRTQMRDER